MSMPPNVGDSRRERLRARTIEEIKQRAFELVDAGGLNTVTISALGKAMGMTPPGLYRYFPSREAVVEALVTAAYTDLGSAVVSAAQQATEQDASARVGLIAQGYRRWALEHPRRYSMLFSDRSPVGEDPVEGIVSFNRAMHALLKALRDIASTTDAGAVTPLDEALQHWGETIEAPEGMSPLTLALGVLLWSRLHGLVALEIAGAFQAMGLDAELLVSEEVKTVVEAAAG